MKKDETGKTIVIVSQESRFVGKSALRPENDSSRKVEVEIRFSVARRNFSGAQKVSGERARSSWVPHRHNTSHYVIRASLDTAIYHSSARIPIYRSSPYVCKTLSASLSPVVQTVRPLRPCSPLSFVYCGNGYVLVKWCRPLARSRAPSRGKQSDQRSCER